MSFDFQSLSPQGSANLLNSIVLLEVELDALLRLFGGVMEQISLAHVFLVLVFLSFLFKSV